MERTLTKGEKTEFRKLLVRLENSKDKLRDVSEEINRIQTKIYLHKKPPAIRDLEKLRELNSKVKKEKG